jgi:DNA-binding response OmpR family regulator
MKARNGLTRLESLLLTELWRERGVAVSYEVLQQLMWGEISERSHLCLVILIHRLRRRIGHAFDIRTVRGSGYQLRGWPKSGGLSSAA